MATNNNNNNNNKNKGIAKPSVRDNQSRKTEIAVNKSIVGDSVKTNITTTSTGPRTPITGKKPEA